MIAGDPTDWESVFGADLIPKVLNCLRRAWPRIVQPGAAEKEVDISRRLFCELVGAKNRSQYPFRFQPECVEVDIAKVIELGRKDIAVLPGDTNREEIYLCMEAKRLNALSGGSLRSLAEEYVQEGMVRYIDGKYSSAVQHAMMLGYVLDGKTTNAIANVNDKIVAHYSTLGMARASGLASSRYKPRTVTLKETEHKRVTDAKHFWIHHVFLAPMKPKVKKLENKKKTAAIRSTRKSNK